MKPIRYILGGIAAAIALFLISCGDGSSSAESSADSAEVASASAPKEYPLKVCVVSGEELGSMGKPHVISHNGTEVRLCCKECVADFNKEPDKYLAMLKAGKAGTMDHSKHTQ